MHPLPSLSIVTISFNQARFLKECLDSVVQQKADGVEYIVVDPGSTDGSREILSNFGNGIDRLILQPDAGPADGLNRGFAAASGDIFAYLNSDDRFTVNAFSWVRRFFADHPEIDVLCGAIRMIDDHGRASPRGRTADLFDVRRYAAGVCCIGQQATFFRRSIFARAGGFNIANRIAWDGELLVDMALAGACFHTTRKALGDFRIYATSITGSANYLSRLSSYHLALEKKLLERGITPYSPPARALLRVLYKLNPLRHTGYLLVR